MKIYVIYDKVAEEGSSLIEAKNDGIARRIFEQTVEKYRLDRNDLQLMCIGEYIAEQPIISGLAVPDLIDVDVEDNE